MITIKNYLVFILLINVSWAQTKNSILLPVKNSGNIKLVECEIQGLPVDFIFDTGASNTTISKDVFIDLLKRGYTFKSEGELRFSLADGSVGVADIYSTDKFGIEDFELSDVTFVVMPNSDAPNLLGQNVFKRFSSYTVKENFIEFILTDQSTDKDKIVFSEKNAEGYAADLIQFTFLTNSIFWMLEYPDLPFNVTDEQIAYDTRTDKKYMKLFFVLKDGLAHKNSYDIEYKSITDAAMNSFVNTEDICFGSFGSDPGFTHQKFLIANISWVECHFIYKFKDTDAEDTIILLLDQDFLHKLKSGGLICNLNYYRQPW